MKHYKFWVKERFNIMIGKQSEPISLLVGSNLSKADAYNLAVARAKAIETRIEQKAGIEDYDVAIKEHIAEIINEQNVITVCRYGAKVLNTSNYTILDFDTFPVDFFDRFKAVRKLEKKQRIIYKFAERLQKYPELGQDFRIYETANGIRVIGKQYFDPTDSRHAKLLQLFGVDLLYVQLSQKQQCYRARLTPKPYRIKSRTIKIGSPLDCETENYQEWETEYAAKSAQFSVVKLVKTIGVDFTADAVIALHDKLCNIAQNRPLA
jgi:hypothetical protein